MRFLWRYVLVVVVLMAASVLLAACGGGGGGGDELTLDEYFQRLEGIKDAAEARADALDEGSLAGEEGAELESFQDYFAEFQAIFEEAVNDMKDLRPPAEARDAHDEFVDALGEAEKAWEDFRERVADVESFSDLEAMLGELEGTGFEAAAEEVEKACRKLQGVADENGIDVDLDCEDEA